MNANLPLPRKACLLVAAFCILLLPQLSRAATLDPTKFVTDLNQLVIDGNNLVATMENVTLTTFGMSSQLATLETQVQTYLDSVGTLYKTVSGSTDNTVLSLTNDMLVPLPMTAFGAPAREGEDVVLKVAREQLDRRMDVDRNNWPNLNEQAYQRNMDRYITSLEGGRETARQQRPQTSGASEAEQEQGAFEMHGPTQPMPAEADDNVLHPD